MRRTMLLLTILASCATGPNSVESTDGVRLWTMAAGRGRAVVVIHGGPGMSHASLEKDLATLEGAYRLVYYDQRGGGRSTLPAQESALTLEANVDDLEALRKAYGLEKMTILAHSFGPAIAARYAIRYPDRVERMVFLGPVPPMKGDFFEQFGQAMDARVTKADRARLEPIRKRLEEGTADMNQACREYWAILVPPRISRTLPASVVQSDLCDDPPAAIHYGMTKTNPGVFGSMGSWDWREELSRLEVPLLVIHGEEDAIPMDMVREWTVMPNARILELKDTAHFPHAERPEIVMPAIAEFFEGMWPRGARR